LWSSREGRSLRPGQELLPPTCFDPSRAGARTVEGHRSFLPVMPHDLVPQGSGGSLPTTHTHVCTLHFSSERDGCGLDGNDPRLFTRSQLDTSRVHYGQMIAQAWKPSAQSSESRYGESQKPIRMTWPFPAPPAVGRRTESQKRPRVFFFSAQLRRFSVRRRSVLVYEHYHVISALAIP